jgi:circadian clock protein KaiB
MKKAPSGRKNALRSLEKAVEAGKSTPYELKLFVTGSTPRSLEAIARIKAICEAELKGRYTLAVVDVHQQPGLAEADQIIALPTLLKTLPLPLRKIIGSFSEKERLLAILGLAPVEKTP